MTALALGATGVLVGRPLYWALAAGGTKGVEKGIDIIAAEIEAALALLGCRSAAEVGREHITRA